MNAETIKSFLVGLGFGVDDASLNKFNKAIASATLRVSALYGSVKLTTAAVAFGISKISDSFEQIGYEYKIIAPAINKALILRQEMLRAYRAAGVNLTQVVQSAVKFNLSITKTRYAMDAIYKSVASRFFPLLTKQSDIFRKKLYDNMPKIQAALERIVKFVFKVFEIVTDFGSRAWEVLTSFYDLLVKLDSATGGWSTKILAAIAAWRFLNLAFIATPLGMLLTGFTALFLLWDDLKVFKEGGQSLINWGSEMTKTIVGLSAAILALGFGLTLGYTAYTVFANGAKIAAAAQAFFNAVLFANPIGLIILAVTALIGLLTTLDSKWKIFGGNLSGFFSGIGGKLLDFVGGANVAENLATSPGGVPSVAPLGGNGGNQTNQNVSQQTQISIHGVADATAAGKAVTFEQYKVNQDLARNMKGATTP